MKLVPRLYLIWDIFRHWREINFIYSNVRYRMPSQAITFGIGDYVEKMTGDYHIKGYVIGLGVTRRTKKTLYMVEHEAEGGGAFTHIYSHFNLVLIRKAK